MELVVIPNKKEEILELSKRKINTFILGLENYSVNYPQASTEEIEKYSKEYSLFIAVNKNIFNSELNDIKEKLISLSKLPILGVLFYDLGILNIVKENNIPLELVWHQTHMVTNYNTCNFYYEKGVKYGFLANEITLEEILEIKEHTQMKLMVECFGYPIMSHSRRTLLTNYFKSLEKEKENKTYELKEKEESYLIKETKEGTSILFGKPINGIKPFFALKGKIDYAVLDMQEVEKEIFYQVIDTFVYSNENNISLEESEEIIEKMNQLIGDNTNFFYKKTIYKVKKGDN